MKLIYNLPSGSDAHELAGLLRIEGLAATVGKYRLSGYPVTVEADRVDPDHVDAIARSVSSRAVRMPDAE